MPHSTLNCWHLGRHSSEWWQSSSLVHDLRSSSLDPAPFVSRIKKDIIKANSIMIYCDTKLRYWQGNMNYWPGENLYDTWNRTEVYFGILVYFSFFRMSNSTGFPTGRGSHSLKLESVLYLSLSRIFKDWNYPPQSHFPSSSILHAFATHLSG